MRVPLSQYPGMNRFVLDWLGGDERFLARSDRLPASKGSPKARPPQAPPRGKPAAPLVEALEKSNQRWGLFAGDQLARWASGETLTIIAGQQAGFAGGPFYTLAKAASLIRFKRDLEKQGIPVTVFFWLATEDHDYDEVATLSLPVTNRQLDLMRIRAVRTAGASRYTRPVVGTLPVPEELITQLLAVTGIPRPAWLRPGITFGDSFAELMASTFGSEMILVDSLLPELRRAGAPLFAKIRANHDRIQRVLHDRAEELEAAGYKEQVIPRDGKEYALLFALDDRGNRGPATGNESPERTSTSALTRPLLQDAVLQPDIFLGGPAEVAYYAQVNVLHELLGVRQPRVALRGHVLVAPRRVERTFERYGVDPSEVFRSADEVLATHEPAGLARIRELRDEGKRELMKRVEQIGELALPADHSLAGSIQKSIGHLEFHFDKLAERAVKGLVRKDRERYAALREAVATLYPDRHVQDRVVSWFGYVCQYGNTVVERVIEEVEPDTSFFKIVGF